MKNALYLLLTVLIVSCGTENNTQETQQDNSLTLVEGSWTLNFNLGEGILAPVAFNLSQVRGRYQLEFINGEEKIVTKSVEIKDKKIKISDAVFNSWFEGEIINSSTIKGHWFKNDGANKIAFEAHHGVQERFKKPENLPFSETNISGKWEVDFSKDVPSDHYKAIGKFIQDGIYLTGTFLTETGDYRFLEGNVYNDVAYLSCFDGAHLFLFKATILDDTLQGEFWSGTHWNEPWIATRNNNFELTNPDSLTFLKEGYDNLEFTFPNLKGDPVSLSDENYNDKVVIVNIMGPWCPNCKDESVYLAELYNSNKAKGLEVIALSFDKSSDFEIAKNTALKVKEHFGINYEILIAGKANKIEASKSLPMLNHVMSYPTSIFIDRKGKIRKIRTGFYGPGTGDYYTRYIEQTNDFVAMLLAEK